MKLTLGFEVDASMFQAASIFLASARLASRGPNAVSAFLDVSGGCRISGIMKDVVVLGDARRKRPQS